jgi:hypothetical protein
VAANARAAVNAKKLLLSIEGFLVEVLCVTLEVKTTGVNQNTPAPLNDSPESGRAGDHILNFALALHPQKLSSFPLYCILPRIRMQELACESSKPFRNCYT